MYLKNQPNTVRIPGPTGENVTVKYSLDGAAPVTLNAPEDVGFAGVYNLSLSAEQCNGDEGLGVPESDGYSWPSFTIEFEVGQPALEATAQEIKTKVNPLTYTVANKVDATTYGPTPDPSKVLRTLTCKDGANNPLANIKVWICNAANPSAIVEDPEYTNDAGEVSFMVNVGVTYYVYSDSQFFEQDTQPYVWEIMA